MMQNNSFFPNMSLKIMIDYDLACETFIYKFNKFNKFNKFRYKFNNCLNKFSECEILNFLQFFYEDISGKLIFELILL